MLSDILKQLIEAVNSIEYKIEKLDCHHICDVEILLFPAFTENITPNIKFIQLVETLSSIGFEITEYNILDETKILLRVKALNFTDFLDAVASLPEKKNSNGSGRAASSVAKTFNVSVFTVYKTRKILKYGSQKIINSLRKGDIHVNTAYKMFIKEHKPKQAGV